MEWYGTAFASTTKEIVNELLSNTGGSPWLNIQTTCYSSEGNCSNSISFNPQVDSISAYEDANPYNRSHTITGYTMIDILTDHFRMGKLSPDSDTIYFILTDSTVTHSVCSQFCGWHSAFIFNSACWIKFSFVGDASNCLNSCTPQNSPSPNNNRAADGMVSVISHELTETVTDYLGNAWYDKDGEENADKCAWSFGDTYLASNGAKANMKLGSRDFLIQRNWDADRQGCYTSRSTAPTLSPTSGPSSSISWVLGRGYGSSCSEVVVMLVEYATSNH